MSDSAASRIIASQALLSIGFPRQEYWSGLPFPSPGDLPNQGIKPRSPALQADSLLSEPPGKPNVSLLFKLFIGFLLPVADSILINILINSAHLQFVSSVTTHIFLLPLSLKPPELTGSSITFSPPNRVTTIIHCCSLFKCLLSGLLPAPLQCTGLLPMANTTVT